DDWTFARTGQEDMFFGGRQFKRDDFRQALADLKATQFSRFTDNFIQFAAHARGARFTNPKEGCLDWFDPNWSVVAQNGAVIAQLAKEAGFKGFYFDVEYYRGGPGPWEKPFNYDARPDKDKRSLEEVAAQVRKRGREWMEAVTAVYPDITIVIIPDTGKWRRTKSSLIQRPDPDWALVPPFVQGMLEGRGKATIIDGIETAYWSNTYATFSGLKEEAQRYGFKNIQHSLGLWVDTEPRWYGGWHTKPEDFDKNYRSPWRFEHTLYDALRATDRYVWLYVWHPKYFFNPELTRPENLSRQGRQCSLCPHSEFPQAYTDAMRNCRKPHVLNQVADVPMPAKKAELYAKVVSAKNILKNGDFEKWHPAPKGWPEGSMLPNEWRSNGALSRNSTTVKDGSYSLATDSPPTYCWITQDIPLDSCRGKTVYFGAWVKADSRMAVGMSLVGYDKEAGRYTVTMSDYHPGHGSWHFISGKRRIPADATGRLRLYFNLRARLPGGTVYIDGATAVALEEH
ncbi:MAG: hypothetical protein GWP14_11185, partial [Actinobacteria bacterium]|nr:hypothetical protein [Actinomycetota bacterium]